MEKILLGNYLTLEPPQYLLSACRFYQDIQVPIERIQQLFRQWMTYVDNGDNTIDVNKLSFEQFYQTIQKSKSLYEMPNKIFDNGTIKIGEFKSFKVHAVVEAKCQRGYSGTIVRLCGNHTTDTA